MTSSGERFTIPRPPDVDDWLDLRADWFNASLAYTLFGVASHQTLGNVCTEKLTGRRLPENAAMRRGTLMEPYLADEVADLLSWKLVESDLLYGCGDLLATLDRLVEGRTDVHIELKTTNKFVGDDGRRDWWWQGQAEMACFGSERTIFGFLDPRLEVGIWEVWRDDSAIARLLERASAIMAILREGLVPDEVDLSGEDVALIWPQDDGETVSLPDSALTEAISYSEWKATEAHAAKQAKQARDHLLALIRGAQVGLVRGQELYSYKSTKSSTSFDMATFAEENPELVKKYTVKVPGYRRLHISKKALGALAPVEEEEEEDIL